MTLEGLGKKFEEARVARNLTIEEAARLTKIRAARLRELEAEDFSGFPSLAYAKGFLVIYGKFLDVDVSPYLEAFESSNAMTVDGYSYLQDNPAPKPSAPVVRVTRPRASLMPVLIGIFVLVIGFALIRLVLEISRIAPRKETTAAATPSATPAIAGEPGGIIAPRAIPLSSAEARRAASIASTQTTPTATPPPSIVAATPIPAPSATGTMPEVRRAEPVHPEDLANLQRPTPTPVRTPVNQVEVRSLQRTLVKISFSEGGKRQSIERWITPGDGPLRVRGEHVAVSVLDRRAVLIRKNGRPLAENDSDVTVQ